MSSTPDSGCRVKCGGIRFTAFILVFLVQASAASTSDAADWSLESTLSETVEFDDNVEVETDSPGNVVGSTSSAAFDLTADAPIYTLKFGGALDFRRFFGPGADSDLDSQNERVDAEVNIRQPRFEVTLDGSIARRDTSFSETIFDFEELGIVSVTTNQLEYSAGGEVGVLIDNSNTVSFSGSYRVVDFEESSDELVPFTNVDLSTAWETDLTLTTQAVLSVFFGYFEADDDEESDSVSVGSTIGVTKQITPRLKFTGSIGGNVIRSSEIVAGQREIDTAIGLLYDIGLDYVLGVSSFDFSFGQDVSASALGGLQERLSLNVGMSHRINRRENFRVQASYTTQAAASSGAGGGDEEDTTFVSLSPSYTIDLSRNWSFELGYQFRMLENEDGRAMSNKVFGTLSRKLVLLP